jgi:CRISPR-associated protein Cas5t
MAAKDNLNGPFQHYEPYWVDGLPTTAAGLSATVSAGIPLRAVVWVHPSAVAPSADNSSARLSASGNARPASGASTRQSSAAGGVPAAVVYTLPAELQQLQNAVRAAAWGFELSELLVLQLSVEDAASPFTRVPAGSSITDPAWAAASSAAAAAKAAAAAAAAAAAPPPDVKPASSAGKAGSNASTGAKTSSSGSARPGSSVAGASAAAAAAALPEEVHGCKELARVLLTVRDQAKRFDKWQKQDVHVYRMPAPSTCTAAAGSSDSQSMRYYSHLLDSAPPERQSVPLVLHAVLEQVRCTCRAHDRPVAQHGLAAASPVQCALSDNIGFKQARLDMRGRLTLNAALVHDFCTGASELLD